MNIPLSNPDITSHEKQLILDVLNTPNLSLGPKLAEFENLFTEYLGSKYAVAVNSGTSGLHLCVKVLNIGKGDEVITTPFSFIASANCMLFEQATPVFVDIDQNTLNIDVNKIEYKITENTKAILPVHVFGVPCQMDKILHLANKYSLRIIEDACEAIGAEYFSNSNENNKMQKIWRKAGTLGDCGVFAFYPNKQITTGEGGMIVTDDEKIAKLCRSLRNQGRGDDGRAFTHERLGYNYRISDINCALGIAQLERIDEILMKRAHIAQCYYEFLKDIPEIKIPHVQQDCMISWFVYVIQLTRKFTEVQRNNIIEELASEGIGSNKYFQPIHLQPFYREMFGYKKGDFPITEHVAERTIALPFYTQLQEEQVEHVCDVLKKILKKYSTNTNYMNNYPFTFNFDKVLGQQVL